MILIVDDDADFVKSVGIVLEKAGHRVISATIAKTACGSVITRTSNF